MTAIQNQQAKSMRFKGHHNGQLFRQTSPTNRNSHFEQVYQQFKKDSHQPYTSSPCDPTSKGHGKHPLLSQTPPSLTDKKNQQNCHKKQMLEFQADNNRIRPFSSNKFDCKSKKTGQRRVKKALKTNLFESAKVTDQRMSQSKKSTDNSDSSELEKVKAENNKIAEIIEMEQKRVDELKKQICEEQRKHEFTKQIYQLNIDKLQKKMVEGGSNRPTLEKIQELQSFSQENNEESDDEMSVISN